MGQDVARYGPGRVTIVWARRLAAYIFVYRDVILALPDQATRVPNVFSLIWMALECYASSRYKLVKQLVLNIHEVEIFSSLFLFLSPSSSL
jgi:hypothetical protein